MQFVAKNVNSGIGSMLGFWWYLICSPLWSMFSSFVLKQTWQWWWHRYFFVVFVCFWYNWIVFRFLQSSLFESLFLSQHFHICSSYFSSLQYFIYSTLTFFFSYFLYALVFIFHIIFCFVGIFTWCWLHDVLINQHTLNLQLHIQLLNSSENQVFAL